MNGEVEGDSPQRHGEHEVRNESKFGVRVAKSSRENKILTDCRTRLFPDCAGKRGFSFGEQLASCRWVQGGCWTLLGSERSAKAKTQSGINGLLPAPGAGPFHLFRLHLDLRYDVLKGGDCHFSAGKVRWHFFSRHPSERHAFTREASTVLLVVYVATGPWCRRPI
jgi:hypothetical protein